MKEVWEKWIPIDNLLDKYYIDCVEDSRKNGFMIRLSSEDEKSNLTMCWDGVVESYRCSEESVLSDLYSNTELNSNTELTTWTFFKIKNSEYLDWIHKKSMGIYDTVPLQHFGIIGANSVIDVISQIVPIVKNI
jgi:hypothetical protein